MEAMRVYLRCKEKEEQRGRFRELSQIKNGGGLQGKWLLTRRLHYCFQRLLPFSMATLIRVGKILLQVQGAFNDFLINSLARTRSRGKGYAVEISATRT
ncbi:hypothetical protein TIFTF001_015176 [Ficus carica]|uniref:Uncharacterized protein n=1 Tax=Ficus carica TaxID=3494 RepID=A0AA88A7C4_FICCA|nr:hypothetical protein TIFTF001_015176 [Ficus carica]